MAHDDWRPDVDVPRDYPPPQRPTAYANTPAGHDQVTRYALQRCLADVEAAAQRLRALLERLSG
jgi:hypothetical protein